MAVDAKRVQAVFLAAVEVADAAPRAALLDRECNSNPELRQRVEALLQAHEAPASILERRAVTPLEAALLPLECTLPLEVSANQAGPSLENQKRDPDTTEDGSNRVEEPLPLE